MKNILYSLALFAALALNAMGAVDTNFPAGPAQTTDNDRQLLKRINNAVYTTSTNTTTVNATITAAGVTNVTGTWLTVSNVVAGGSGLSGITNVTGTTLAIVGNVGVTNGSGSGLSGVTNVTGTTLAIVGNVGITNATSGLSTNGVVATISDGTGATGLIMYSDTGGANNSAPLVTFPMIFNGSTLDRWDGRIGFHTFTTNVNLSITNGTAVTNAGYALGPEVEIAGVNRINGRAVDLLNLCIWGGDSNALNIACILVTKAPCPSWTNGAIIKLDSADLATNLMTVIPFNGALPTSTNYIGTNCVIDISSIGKTIKPLTNSIFLHCVSGASGNANANTSWLRIAVGQN